MVNIITETKLKEQFELTKKLQNIANELNMIARELLTEYE